MVHSRDIHSVDRRTAKRLAVTLDSALRECLGLPPNGCDCPYPVPVETALAYLRLVASTGTRADQTEGRPWKRTKVEGSEKQSENSSARKENDS